MHGDPRKQAVLFHYDGWAPHNTSSRHSVGTITVTHACMAKVDRADAKYARVYSFVPVWQLPKDSPHKYDAFLQPLLNDLIDLYIEGQEVFFKRGIEGYSVPDDTPLLRVVPLLLTADLRAHAEVGLTSAGGFKGCRRCHVAGEYIAERNHYYYGNYQYRYRFPASPRTACSNRTLGREVDSAATEAERKRLSKQHGVTGESILFQLYDLCQFDPLLDLVVDVIHSVVLNLIRSELENHLLKDLGGNAACRAVDRLPDVGGVLDRKDLDRNLRLVPWYMELRDGRAPQICSSDPTGKHKLGNWKAEEFSKFIVVAPYILREIIPEQSYRCFCLLTELYNLLYFMELRVQGWTTEHQEFLRKLLWRHHIDYENLYGLSACTENVEYSLHLVEDVSRHSAPDNYWCYLYERQVKYYKHQTTNMKTLCKTFSDRAAQLHFVQTCLSTMCAQDLHVDAASNRHEQDPVLLQARSLEQALKLKQDVASTDMPPAVARVYDSGVVLGCPRFTTLSDRQFRDIQHWLSSFYPNKQLPSQLPRIVQTYSRVLKSNVYDFAVVYRKNECVIISDYDQPQEWVMQVTELMVYGPVFNEFHHFIDGEYLVAKSVRGEVVTDKWTKQPWMVKRNFERLRVQPMKALLRKVMLYPHLSLRNHFLVIDPSQPVVIRKLTMG